MKKLFGSVFLVLVMFCQTSFAGTWSELVLILNKDELTLTKDEICMRVSAYLLTDVGKKLIEKYDTTEFEIRRHGEKGEKIILVPKYKN